MDRSIFLARLLGPTFAAIALGILINLGMYESMIAETLHPGILFYLSGLLSLVAGLAIVNLHNTWCADWRVIITVLGLVDDDRRHHSRRSTADRYSDRFDHLWRPRPHDLGRADRRRAGRFPQLQGLRAARLTAVELTGWRRDPTSILYAILGAALLLLVFVARTKCR